MLENIISVGSAAIGVGGSAASIYSAVSAIGTGRFQNRLLALLAPRNVVRLNEHILYAPDSEPLVARGSRPIDPRAVLQSLERVQRALKQDIITSGILPTPEELQRQFNLNPRDCLVGIEPLHELRIGRSPDWAPILFMGDGVPLVGWQKVGMLRALLGFEFSGNAEAWIKRPQPAPAPAAVPTPAPPPQRVTSKGPRTAKPKSAAGAGKKRDPKGRR